jgi:hypothetical protein
VINLDKDERKQTTVRIKKDIFELIEKDSVKDCRNFTNQLDYIFMALYGTKKLFCIGQVHGNHSKPCIL